MTEHFDVVIVGAGISGIGAGYHLKKRCPTRSYVILEGREQIGGTWDLFRYPGIRSDSDMYTLGFAFRPWTGEKAIADGASIREYLQSTARDKGIDQHIRFKHKVVSAAWSSETSHWTVTALRGAEQQQVTFTCSFLFMGSGYYRYEAGFTPDFPGRERFRGQIIHPQHWPEDLDYKGKRVVVIGSGATAVTLVPSMANEGAGHVTMLQRSPTYILSRPARDGIAHALRRFLPEKLAYDLVRWKQVLLGMFFFGLSRRRPQLVAEGIRKRIQGELGDAYDAKHFTPTYNPWDQRVCLIPDSDLFTAIKAKKVSIVTDHIDTFTETGIKLKSGEELPADIIVTATGLVMQPLGGTEVTIDGKRFESGKALGYKGMMFRDVPNFANSFGYTNASWTLKADLTAAYMCRLLNHMQAHGYTQCTPRLNDPSVKEEPWLDFSSGYVQRASGILPKQGSKVPWRVHQNYALDLLALKLGSVDDGAMEFR
jgi:cation diffusion facilitator CzcD-associated flavoprotein CzcO